MLTPVEFGGRGACMCVSVCVHACICVYICVQACVCVCERVHTCMLPSTTRKLPCWRHQIGLQCSRAFMGPSGLLLDPRIHIFFLTFCSLALPHARSPSRSAWPLNSLSLPGGPAGTWPCSLPTQREKGTCLRSLSSSLGLFLILGLGVCRGLCEGMEGLVVQAMHCSRPNLHTPGLCLLSPLLAVQRPHLAVICTLPRETKKGSLLLNNLTGNRVSAMPQTLSHLGCVQRAGSSLGLTL